MTSHDLAADRSYCRHVLPRVSRTFAINIRLLAGEFGEAVRVGYLLCRAADTLEDSWPGSAAEMRERFDRFLGAVDGEPGAAEALAVAAAALGSPREDVGLVADLPRVLRVHRALAPADRDVVAACVRTLAGGMRRYAARAAERPPDVPFLDDTEELHDYCWVVAGCVGDMLTRLFVRHAGAAVAPREARLLALAPTVGEALQLTNILLDWPSDVRRGRCFVPAAWLAEFDARPADLVDAPTPAAVALGARLESLARGALARVPDYLDLVPSRHVRYRLFCVWPSLWALASLRHARADARFPWGPVRPKLPRSALWRSALASLVAGHRPRSLRRLYAAWA